MSKLTKTIEENKKWNQHFEENPGDNLLTKLEPVNKTISYLLSLLEEKDKALQEILEQSPFSGIGPLNMKDIARKALNTSSNNEGEMI